MCALKNEPVLLPRPISDSCQSIEIVAREVADAYWLLRSDFYGLELLGCCCAAAWEPPTRIEWRCHAVLCRDQLARYLRKFIPPQLTALAVVGESSRFSISLRAGIPRTFP